MDGISSYCNTYQGVVNASTFMPGVTANLLIPGIVLIVLGIVGVIGVHFLLYSNMGKVRDEIETKFSTFNSLFPGKDLQFSFAPPQPAYFGLDAGGVKPTAGPALASEIMPRIEIKGSLKSGYEMEIETLEKAAMPFTPEQIAAFQAQLMAGQQMDPDAMMMPVNLGMNTSLPSNAPGMNTPVPSSNPSSSTQFVQVVVNPIDITVENPKSIELQKRIML